MMLLQYYPHVLAIADILADTVQNANEMVSSKVGSLSAEYRPYVCTHLSWTVVPMQDTERRDPTWSLSSVKVPDRLRHQVHVSLGTSLNPSHD